MPVAVTPASMGRVVRGGCDDCVDPHQGSHTAVAIGTVAEPLGELRVRVSVAQAQRLLAWAVGWPERTWAIEGATGLGDLLAQQHLLTERPLNA